jgi:hypothetical protein
MLDYGAIQIDKGILSARSPVKVEDVVECWVQGELVARKILEVRQANHLPRFRVEGVTTPFKWIGKTKIKRRLCDASQVNDGLDAKDENGSPVMNA